MTVHSYIINRNILFNSKECYLFSTESGNREIIGSNPSGLLLYLIKNQGSTVTLDEISDYFMGKGRVVNATTAIQYISKLRKTLRSLEETGSVIETIKGGGYYIPSHIDISEYNSNDSVVSNSDINTYQESFDEGISEIPIAHQGFKLNGKFTSIIPMVFLFIFSFLIFVIWNSYFFTHLGDVEYRIKKVNEGCSISIDHDYPEEGSYAENILIKDLSRYCNKYKFAYLTYFDYSNNYSIIFCKDPIYKSADRDICSSLSRLGND